MDWNECYYFIKVLFVGFVLGFVNIQQRRRRKNTNNFDDRLQATETKQTVNKNTVIHPECIDTNNEQRDGITNIAVDKQNLEAKNNFPLDLRTNSVINNNKCETFSHSIVTNSSAIASTDNTSNNNTPDIGNNLKTNWNQVIRKSNNSSDHKHFSNNSSKHVSNGNEHATTNNEKINLKQASNSRDHDKENDKKKLDDNREMTSSNQTTDERRKSDLSSNEVDRWIDRGMPSDEEVKSHPFLKEVPLKNTAQDRLKGNRNRDSTTSVYSASSLYSEPSSASSLSEKTPSEPKRRKPSDRLMRSYTMPSSRATSPWYNDSIQQKSTSKQQLELFENSLNPLPEMRNEELDVSYVSRDTQTEKSRVYALELQSNYSTSIVNTGSLWFAECIMDFVPGALLGEVEVQIGCQYPSQSISSESIMITPDVTCSFDKNKLQFDFKLTMPTCFISTDDMDPAKVKINRLGPQDKWSEINSLPLQQSLNVMFSEKEPGHYRCIATTSELLKISKSLLVQGFLTKDNYNSVVVCVAENWPHVDKRMTRESITPGMNQPLFSCEICVGYKESVKILMSGKYHEATPSNYELSSEDIWRLHLYRKFHFEVSPHRSKLTAFSCTTSLKRKDGFAQLECFLTKNSDSTSSLKKTLSSSSLLRSSRKHSRQDTISESSFDSTTRRIDDQRKTEKWKKKFSKNPFKKSKRE